MKLAWFSNSPWAGTGYGVATAEMLPKLKDDGHEVCGVSNYGLQGSPLDWNGIPILPSGYDAWSNDIAGVHIRNWIQDKGWGITLYDVWTMQGSLWDGIPLASWTPIDHDPAPEQIAKWFMQPNQNRVAIAMSKFGRDRLVSAGVPDVQYAPHTVNTKLFTPVGPNYRKQFTIPEDAHVTICNAANKGVPSRKGYPELLAAWVMFANKHDDAWLYLHTEEHGLAGGLQLGRLLKALKAPMDRVRIAPQYQYRAGIPTSEMPGIYRMGDVICMPSYGEGFGIPAVEAGAVGVAQIVSDWTAQPELLGAGWKVGGQPWWNEPMASWWLIPNIEEIGAALEESYKVKGDKAASAALSEQARQFALQYDTDTVYESHWKPILSYLESRLSPPKNRAQRRAK